MVKSSAKSHGFSVETHEIQGLPKDSRACSMLGMYISQPGTPAWFFPSHHHGTKKMTGNR
jgi:hypothetical protein